MYYGRQNNRQDPNYNTNFVTYYSDTSALSVGAWNKLLSIQLRPAVGKDENGVTNYADQRDQYISTSITLENAAALVEGFNENVLPAINNGGNGAASIVMGNAQDRKVLTVGYEGGNAYLSVATELDDVGKSSKVIKHVFNKKPYLINYDPTKGAAQEKPVEAELLNFMHLVASVKNLLPVTAHSLKYHDIVRPARTNSNAGFNAMSTTRPQSSFAPAANAAPAPISTGNEGLDFMPFS